MSGTAPPFPLCLFILFSGKSVPSLRIPNTQTYNLVLFSHIYYVTYINFDAMWKGILGPMKLEIRKFSM